MARVLEVIFRRIFRLLLLIILLPLVCLAVAFTFPRSYQATATLFALRPYEIVTTINQGTNSSVTSAQSQAGVLSELLQTRSFALSVASGTGIASMLKLDPNTKTNLQLRDDALAGAVSHNVQVTVQGDDLVVISYKSPNPNVAQQVVVSIIQNYAKEAQHFGQSLLNSYQTQLIAAKQSQDAAVAAETQYVQSHPNLTQTQLLEDAGYTQLHSQVVSAQTAVQNLQSSIDTINLQIASQGNDASSLFKVIDAPVVPIQPVSRTTQLLIAAVVGLVVALLASTLYLTILVRRDRAVYSVGDLGKVTFLPVITQLPHLSQECVPLLLERYEH